MFEKLLSLLLHAKGGGLATVLVLGASGALVTATVENGLTTVTITQPSTTTTGSETTTGGSTTTTTTTTNPVILALFNRTKAEEDPTGTATGNGCSDAAHTNNEQVKRVNDAYKTDHAAVQALSKTAPKTDAAKTLVKSSDNKIKGFRQGAVKQIHDLFKSDECKGNDDEDKADEDKDTEDDDDNNDSTTGATGATGATTGTTSTTTTTTVAISCSDAKACADAAIKAMDDEVLSLTAALDTLKTAPATTNTTTDKSKSDTKSTKSTGKGKGHSEGKSHNDDD
jgi:hypothetical protein